jgi:HD-GYP domain-containing protein (c-di-GMP phosphodiesterase class II)
MRLRILAPLVGAGAALLWHRGSARRQSAERLAAATLEALLNAIDANDEVTGAHVRRVAEYALILAGAVGLEDDECRQVERVALFHDIGKMHEALFDIVHDDSALSDEERRAIATHPQRGADVLAPLAAFYPELAEGVLSHHERWDGTGYPRGLSGTAIPRVARLVAVADTFDAVTHARRYKAGKSAQRGAEVIAAGRGTQFDPEFVDRFLAPDVFPRIEAAMHADETRATLPGGPALRAIGGGRRRREREKQVPEVSFRWRASQVRGDAASPAPRG